MALLVEVHHWAWRVKTHAISNHSLYFMFAIQDVSPQSPAPATNHVCCLLPLLAAMMGSSSSGTVSPNKPFILKVVVIWLFHHSKGKVTDRKVSIGDWVAHDRHSHSVF